MMKKIAILSLLLMIISLGASAQLRSFKHRNGGSRVCYSRVTVPERHQLRKDMLRVRMAQRIAGRDGVVTPVERVRIHRLKSKTRRDAVRFRYS